MSLLTKSVPLVTNSSGDASATVRAGGMLLRRIDFEIGTLSTPDLDITDEDSGVVVLSVDGVAADAVYYPTVTGTDALGAARGNLGTAVTLATSAASDDIIDTAAAHGLAEGHRVRFTALTGGTGLTVGTDYYVTATSLAAQTFRIATTKGGAAIGFTADITAGTVVRVDDTGAMPFPALGRLEIVIAGGGDTKTGRVVLLYER